MSLTSRSSYSIVKRGVRWTLYVQSPKPRIEMERKVRAKPLDRRSRFVLLVMMGKGSLLAWKAQA
jgi:hypothetical protein